MNTALPYIYTRGSFIKKKLLQKEDYQKLLKMELAEIIKFLEESRYKKAIDELAIRLQGVELVEAALSRTLADEFSRARRMVGLEHKFIVDLYLRRWDLYNAKTALRCIHGGFAREIAELSFVAAGKMGKEFFSDLLKMQSVDEAIKKLDFLDQKTRDEALQAFSSTKSLVQVENTLDSRYYTKLFRLGRRLGTESLMFKRFLCDEVRINNLKTALRLRNEGMDTADVRKYLVVQEGNEAIMSIINAPNLDAMVAEIQKNPYGRFIDASENATLVDVEISCDRYLIAKYTSSLYMNPFSLTPLLTVMFLLAAEVENLRRLVKAKQLGMDQEFIEKKAVVPCWR